MGQKVYLLQAKKISFVETGKNAEYSIWGARIEGLTHALSSLFVELTSG